MKINKTRCFGGRERERENEASLMNCVFHQLIDILEREKSNKSYLHERSAVQSSKEQRLDDFSSTFNDSSPSDMSLKTKDIDHRTKFDRRNHRNPLMLTFIKKNSYSGLLIEQRMRIRESLHHMHRCDLTIGKNGQRSIKPTVGVMTTNHRSHHRYEILCLSFCSQFHFHCD